VGNNEFKIDKIKGLVGKVIRYFWGIGKLSLFALVLVFELVVVLGDSVNR
jgi:hypothetical protein